MKINLVKNGIFPIKVDLEGNDLGVDTGYNFSGTVQGEGKLTGMPCIFVRLSSCNLRCIWFNADGEGSPCDTPYSSFNAEKNMWEVEDVVKIINLNNPTKNIKHVVVSGGEPTLQTAALGMLLKLLQESGYHTTIETNGTIYDTTISKHTNLVSISPKLFNSVPTQNKFTGKEIELQKVEYNEKWEQTHNNKRINIDAIQRYIDDCYESIGKEKIYDKPIVETKNIFGKKTNKDYQLKFVVSTEDDLKEIIEIQNKLVIKDTFDITLMPEGYFAEDVMQKSKWVIEKCIKYGYRFTTRLHTLIFGTSRGI